MKAFIAALAVLMHAFWPMIGQLRAATPAMVQVICSVHGTMQIPAEETPAERTPPCAMCSAAGTALASSAPGTNPPQLATHRELRLEDRAAPPQGALHSPSSPRAPPAAS